MITVCTWFWGDKYSRDYVTKLKNGVDRHLKQPHQFICFEPDGDETRGCLCRIRMFDPEWQEGRGFGRLVCIDLDSIIVGPLDPLFDRPEPFVIAAGLNMRNLCPFNCSLMMLRMGAHPEVWTDLKDWAGDDQEWLAHKLPNAATWTFRDGIYGYAKPGWRSRGAGYPDDARIVTFAGASDPSQFISLNWVRENWV